MTLPVQQFPLLTAAQISPVMTGIGQANTLAQQTMQTQYMHEALAQQLRKQQLSNQISQAQANVAPQMSQAQLAYQQAKTPNLNAATQYILSGQLPASQAQAGLVNSETAKNQFVLNHPGLMLSPQSIAGQVAQIQMLKELDQKNGVSVGTPLPPSSPYQKVPQSVGSGSPLWTGNAPIPQSNNNVSASNILPANPYNMPQTVGNAPPQYLMNQSQNNIQGSSPQNLGNRISLDQDGLPSTSELTGLAIQNWLSPMEKNAAQAAYYQKMASGYDFKSLPPQEKSASIAQLAGMGVEPSVAAHLLNNGATISSVATQLGLDPNNLPSPLYAASQQTVNLIQRRNQALSEINSIQPQITQAMAPYARRFYNYSPTQIANAISNDNPDQQARFLAAKALMPEMSSLRLKAMGGQVGIEAIREVNNASMGNIKSFQGLVSPKVYAAAQNYVDQWINQGASAANKIGLASTVGNLNNGGKPVQSSTMINDSPKPQLKTQMVRVIDPSGRTGSIPASNLADALKAGYRSAQ